VCVDGFDYYTIALIAISFCGAGKRDCPRWTIKFRGWKARNFLESFFFLSSRLAISYYYYYSQFNR
jgi:hypothetical protein